MADSVLDEGQVRAVLRRVGALLWDKPHSVLLLEDCEGLIEVVPYTGRELLREWHVPLPTVSQALRGIVPATALASGDLPLRIRYRLHAWFRHDRGSPDFRQWVGYYVEYDRG